MSEGSEHSSSHTGEITYTKTIKKEYTEMMIEEAEGLLITKKKKTEKPKTNSTTKS